MAIMQASSATVCIQPHLCDARRQWKAGTQGGPQGGQPGVQRRLIAGGVRVVTQAMGHQAARPQGLQPLRQLECHHVVLCIPCAAQPGRQLLGWPEACACSAPAGEAACVMVSWCHGTHTPESPKPNTALWTWQRESAGRFLFRRKRHRRFMLSGTSPCTKGTMTRWPRSQACAGAARPICECRLRHVRKSSCQPGRWWRLQR
jgi:hypothetical protein